MNRTISSEACSKLKEIWEAFSLDSETSGADKRAHTAAPLLQIPTSAVKEPLDLRSYLSGQLQPLNPADRDIKKSKVILGRHNK